MTKIILFWFGLIALGFASIVAIACVEYSKTSKPSQPTQPNVVWSKTTIEGHEYITFFRDGRSFDLVATTHNESCPCKKQ